MAADNKVLKNKVVDFPLSVEMRLPDLVQKGFQREEITALFTELQSKAFGLYVPGTRGKGCAATFEFFVDLPGETYRMVFQVQKLHTDYAGKPVVNAAEAGSIDNQQSYKVNPKCPGIKKTTLTASRYSVVIEGSLLRAQLTDKGADSVEKALDVVWDKVKDNVNEPACRNMTAKEAVASKLMGFGIYNLS